MDIRQIRKLVDFMTESGIVTEIEVKSGEESIRISCQGQRSSIAVATPASVPQVTAAQAPTVATTPEVAPTSGSEDKINPALQGHIITAPMVGTLYIAASPEAAPYVEIGQKVRAGDTLCTIEAMKMFNPIEADKSGTVTARLVENGQPVEYNQPLFTIETEE